MRVETITRNIYEFKELSDTAKEHAIDKWRESEDFSSISYDNNDYYKTLLAENGFNVTDEEFRFSLANCQGDGVSFLCKDFNQEILFTKFLEKCKYNREYKLLSLYDVDYSLSINISNYHYVHEKSVYFECILENANYLLNAYPLVCKKIESMLSDFTDFVENLRLTLCIEIEKVLQAEIDYLLTEEYVIESIECNKYEFYENGQMI